MKKKFYLVIFLGLIQISCSVMESEEEERRGTLITSQINTNFLNLIWSKTSDEIITGGDNGIKVIDINTKEIRTIMNSSTFAMQLSNDGETIYYLQGSSLQGDVEPLYNISLNGQNKELLIDEVYVDCFCVCPQGLYIAYKGDTSQDVDSVLIFNTQNRSNRFLCIGVPKVFSPDGKQLICSSFMGANPEYFIVDIETSVSTPLSLEPLGIDEYYHSFIVTFKWLDNGIYILYSLGDPEIFYVHNFTTGVRAYSWEIPSFGTMFFCWSNDASKVAYWRWDNTYNRLFVADSKGISEEALTNEHYVCNITFSPDNEHIAYVIGNSIYMKNI